MSGRGMTVYLALLFIAPTLGFFHVLAIGTFGLTPMEFLFFGAFGYAVYHGVWLGRPFVLPRRFDVGMMIGMLGVILISSIAVAVRGDAADVTQSLKTVAHLLFLWGFTFTMICLPISASQWVSALRVHFVVSFLVMIFGLYQLPARMFDLPGAWIEMSNISFQRGAEEAGEITQLALKFENFYRATSIFVEPSALAGYGAATLAMLVVPLFRGGPTIIRNSLFLWASIVVTILGIFLTFSLSGAMLVAAIGGLTLILYPRESWRRFLAIGGVSLILIVVADRVVEKATDVSVLELFSQRIGSLVSGAAAREETGAVEGESLTQRVADYRVSYEAWQESPVIGVGLGNFGNSVVATKNNVQFPATTIGSVLAELGIVGLVVFLVFLVGTYVNVQMDERAWTAQRRGEDSDIERLAPILPFRVALLIFVAFTGNFFVTSVLWFDMAIVLSGQSAIRRELGIERSVAIHVVRTSWRERWIRAQTA